MEKLINIYVGTSDTYINYIIMILDITNNIKNFMFDVRDVLNICIINKYTDEHIYIENLYDLDYYGLNKLTQSVIEQKKYSKLKKLYIYNNRKINNLNHLKNSLRVLNCGVDYNNENIFTNIKYVEDMLCTDMFTYARNYDEIKEKIYDIHNLFDSEIGQEGISELNLVELYCDRNMKIKNIDNMKDTLKILSCKEICGINQKSISDLKLEKIICDNNPKIINLNHMYRTLKILECRHNSSYIKKKDGKMIGKDGISQLKLKEIYIGGNSNIENLNHMKESLKLLDIDNGGNNIIKLSQEGISDLNLECINLEHKVEQIDLNHMAGSLKCLRIYQSIDISKLHLLELHIYGFDGFDGWNNNFCKINLNHMKKSLKKLVIKKNRYIDQNCISELELKYLHVEDITEPLNLDHMVNTLEYVTCDKHFYKKNKLFLSNKNIKYLSII